jgi:hypothetical protein
MRKRPKRRRPSHYDLQELTKGTSKELGIHAQTVGSVCEQFSRSRDKAKHSLRFHASFDARSARCRFRNRAGRSKATPSPISGSASGILAASAGAPQANGCLGCVLRGTEHRQCRCVSTVAPRSLTATVTGDINDGVMLAIKSSRTLAGLPRTA